MSTRFRTITRGAHREENRILAGLGVGDADRGCGERGRSEHPVPVSGHPVMREFAATNEKNTCLWCGRKLTKDARWVGLFDTQSCAELFGASLATELHRMKPKPVVR